MVEYFLNQYLFSTLIHLEDVHLAFEITLFDIELTIRIILAVILGAVIGFEREITHKPAGLRTHIFISMGACLFTIAALYLIPSEPDRFIDTSRIAAGIVTGTAFIGAGSIIAARGNIRGLTTAASLWVVGSIGLIVGLGNYLFPIVATIIAFIVLRIGIIADKKEMISLKKTKQ
jgi:putative Mg2+ transporter-C (MgtC) family protein